MADRARGTRRSMGLILMTAGVVLLLFTITLTLSEMTTSIAHVRDVVFVVGIAALLIGGAFYGLARLRIS